MATDMRDADLLFKALADPGRRELMDRLHAHDGQTLTALCQHLEMSRQGVTQHLAVLEAANLVAVQRRGREKLHFLNPVPLQEIYDRWIRKFERPRLKALRDLKRRLENEGDDEGDDEAED
jgi:DNA-binding transcriptional ArsR family regulator